MAVFSSAFREYAIHIKSEKKFSKVRGQTVWIVPAKFVYFRFVNGPR